MINILEKTISDKIAAGEVVDRPASIVKELTENSIDAGASHIVLEIKDGGRSYIRLTDNGCGIDAKDVELAFRRHATSKIEQVSDLDSIKSLGFRGEALASIAAVTHTTLITKTREGETGRRLIIHGGEVIENEPTGCPDGTTLIVTDLFYNTPARRSFLKSDRAESSRIIEFFSEIAIAYPRIRFQMVNNGRMVFATDGMGNLRSTLLEVYHRKEYRNLIEIDASSGGLSIYGAISKPTLNRATRREQVFFVNGRIVKSKVIEDGVNDGYRQRMFEKRHPIAFLFLSTDPRTIDVNIHPTKQEIRFYDENAITSFVAKSIESAILTDEAVANPAAPELEKTQRKEVIPNNQTIFIDPKYIEGENKLDQDAQQELTLKSIRGFLSQRREDELMDEEAGIGGTAEMAEINEVCEGTSETGLSLKDFDMKPEKIPFDFNRLNITGSVFSTYITAEDQDYFYLIDQHAAHERINYERLVSRYLSQEGGTQQLLTPFVLDLTASICEKEEVWIGPLRRMGFVIDSFGPETYRVTGVPLYMEIGEAQDFVNDYIDMADDIRDPRNTVVIDKIITRSCKSSVKAHDHLSYEEQTALIDQMKNCHNPFSCPHGRPTFIRFSRYELERLFLRA